MSQSNVDESGPLAFFKAQHQAFAETLASRRGREDLLDGLLSQAFSSFEGNVEIQAEGMPPLACHKGCATCCTLRVIATAPEILLIERFIRATVSDQHRLQIDLERRVADANGSTLGLDEPQRVALRRWCPFIINGVCVIYSVRPLACRGHTSYDKYACVEAAAGRAESVPFSVPHMTVRSLVQNALQSALRDAGYAWGTYELNQATHQALSDGNEYRAWMRGDEVFADAQVSDVSVEEMANLFDRIHHSA
ncbi:MAG: YkgJ family cysteine cluster protein [Methylococcaceae bacterium]|nr:YkgJ family cysteine cluster protein [Methylococcaceae bacterium]